MIIQYPSVNNPRYPVSVVVPTRYMELDRYVNQALQSACPQQIILVTSTDPINPNKQRNVGFGRVNQPHVFFMDEDILVDAYIFREMLTAMHDQHTQWAYSDFFCINHPLNGTFKHTAGAYSWERLKKGNFISTMSLVKTSIMPRWDETIERLQDFDCWCQLGKSGYAPAYVDKPLFTAIYDAKESGITKALGYNDAYKILKTKHGL